MRLYRLFGHRSFDFCLVFDENRSVIHRLSLGSSWGLEWLAASEQPTEQQLCRRDSLQIIHQLSIMSRLPCIFMVFCDSLSIICYNRSIEFSLEFDENRSDYFTGDPRAYTQYKYYVIRHYVDQFTYSYAPFWPWECARNPFHEWKS